MKSSLLPVVLMIAFVSGTCQGTAVPPVGCESKIDGLRNEVGALEKESNRVPYFQKFILTPAQQDPSNSLSVEWVLPNYPDALLAHVTVDHKVTEVLLPGATAAPSGGTTQAPYQVTFSSKLSELWQGSGIRQNSGVAWPSAAGCFGERRFRYKGDRGRVRSNHGTNTSRDYRVSGL
jgi:hypothetical protein